MTIFSLSALMLAANFAAEANFAIDDSLGDTMRATVWDVGDATCISVTAPEHTLLFTSDTLESGVCGKALADHQINFDSVIYAGSDDVEPVWAGKKMLTQPRIARLSEDDRYAKYGMLEIDYLSLPQFDPTSEGFAVKLSYANSRILLMSDTAAGKLANNEDQPQTTCADLKAKLDDDQKFFLASDLMLVPHGGSLPGLSDCLIDLVAPHLLIVASGHGKARPSNTVMNRFIKAGVIARNILRTDRGDDEGDAEWAGPYRQLSCVDPVGDDTIAIEVANDGRLKAYYIDTPEDCDG